jgi:ATP synthase protein I
MAPAPKHGEPSRSTNHQVAAYAGVGLQFAGSIVLFLFLGRWADERLGTEPWLLMAGVFLGAGAGFYSLYRQLVIEPRERERKAKQREDEGL